MIAPVATPLDFGSLYTFGMVQFVLIRLKVCCVGLSRREEDAGLLAPRDEVL